MHLPWFPKMYAVKPDIKIRSLVHSGEGWQIYELADGNNMLAVLPGLASGWDKTGLLALSAWEQFSFGKEEYYFIVSSKNYLLTPLNSCLSLPADKTEAMSFANALRETRKIIPDMPLDSSIFLEKYSRLLPLPSAARFADDGLLLGTYIAGGVRISIKDSGRLKNLSIMSLQDINEVIKTAGLEIHKENDCENNRQEKQKFSLPGAEYLEHFFYENVIDIAMHPEKYEPLGISFPSPIVLYGQPGTGKTYAAEQLADFLGWPVFSINSNSVGSPYIHQTSKKISELFEKACSASPSMIIIDEMESYLSNRDTAQEYKVEEIGEFLRLIPEAAEHNVLIIGMTNMLDKIDPAILRAGRFDHKIEVKMPNRQDIEAMINKALEKLPVEPNILLDHVILSLEGHPRSDVAFVVKEAARLTAFKGKKKISQQEIDEALQNINLSFAPKKHNIGFEL